MNNKKLIKPLPPDALYKVCTEDELSFQTTAELKDIDMVIGQQRAIDALQFGVQIGGKGYNTFAFGAPGTGKLSAVRRIVTQTAAQEEPANDWCYVNNFKERHKPIALYLPPGRGIIFRQEMEQLMEELSIAIAAAFESDEYRSRIEEIDEELKDRQSNSLNEIREEAKQYNVAFIKTPTGFAFAPIDKDEEVLSPEKFNKLSEEERKKIQNTINDLQEKLKQQLNQYPSWRKEAKEKVKALDREVAKSAINHLIQSLRDRYQELPQVIEYLEAVEEDIIKNVQDFRSTPEESAMILFGAPPRGESLRRYTVNLLVDNSDQESAPVIYENLPGHANLIGRSEYQSQMGTLVTDFTLIKPGALHRANGGYLILDARKVLLQPYAWESLKRTLEAGEIRIESLEKTLSLISTVALEPQPIPLDVKVILVGDRMLYYLLSYYDPDFQDLFKVAADFDDIMDRNAENSLLYAQLIGGLAREEGLKALEMTAVTRLIEHSARLASDAEKLSTHMRSITDLLIEADFMAKQAKHEHIMADDIQAAIDKQIHRSDRIRERMQEQIERGTILIDTGGEAVGQINGLSVIQLNNYAFGQPSRITATIRLGEGEVIDIEREAELGGAIHSKGVLILTNFLASRYARVMPLSINASIVFEQSYGEVEGDSASLAELCALLSAAAGLPIRQSLAVTGSINQHGQIQPIGGVNEKIEGFFDICNKRGLTGEQGVLVPETNVKHLMLRQDIVQAAAAGRFNIYSIETVDQALEILMGQSAGERDEQGLFPADSINGRVEAQLNEFAAIRREFAHDVEKKEAR